MKICDILGVGGSFSEIVVVDYDDQTILLGHDGPFHIAISEGKPVYGDKKSDSVSRAGFDSHKHIITPINTNQISSIQ